MEVAHELRDDVPANPIVFVEQITLRHRQASIVDGRVVRRELFLVLEITPLHVTDA